MAVSTYLEFEKQLADLEKKIAELESTGGAAVGEEVGKLREMSPLWEMVREGIDLNAVQWAAH